MLVCFAELPDSSYILKSQALVLVGYAFLLGAPVTLLSPCACSVHRHSMDDPCTSSLRRLSACTCTADRLQPDPQR